MNLRPLENKPFEDFVATLKEGEVGMDAIDVGTEKRADILHSTFKHYFDVALDHHTKAATTSHIILIIVAALIALLELEQTNTLGATGIGLAVMSVGLFGVIWVRKQHERYTYWRYIAECYEKELTNLVPGIKPGQAYDEAAREAAADDGYGYVTRIRDRHLWVVLHCIVAIVGFVLFAVDIIQ